jgi:hypothetical protein
VRSKTGNFGCTGTVWAPNQIAPLTVPNNPLLDPIINGRPLRIWYNHWVTEWAKCFKIKGFLAIPAFGTRNNILRLRHLT